MLQQNAFCIWLIDFSSVFSLLVNEWIVHPSTAQGSSVVKFSVAFKFKRF